MGSLGDALTLAFCCQLMAVRKARLKLLKICQITLSLQKRNRLPLYSQDLKRCKVNWSNCNSQLYLLTLLILHFGCPASRFIADLRSELSQNRKLVH
jgi:hypothetical protein